MRLRIVLGRDPHRPKARPSALILEANGLNHRCPVPWTEGVNLLRDHDMGLTWPNFETGQLHIFEDPAPKSPFLDYLVRSPKSRVRLKRRAKLRASRYVAA
jgi:hypothetical protein